MQTNLEARLKKLEAKNPAPDPWDELNSAQLQALELSLRAEHEGGEPSDEVLWNEGMSRVGYEMALESISTELAERIVAWVQKNPSA
jgi:hypothetical protein